MNQTYITQKYDTPIQATIWFANPYIPWHDPEVPGGKLGEELTINENGKCMIQTMVANSEKRKSISGKPIETIKIESNLAKELLLRILSVLNYLGTPKSNKSFSLKETTILLANKKSITFINYEDDDQYALYKLSMSIRNALDRADLMVFDGNSHEDFIDRFEIRYTFGKGCSERLTLNRNKEAIIYTRNQDGYPKISTTYTFDDQISKILDNLNPVDFTSTIPGIPKNAIKDSKLIGNFQFKIIRRKLKPIKIAGKYEKYELPEIWAAFMEKIYAMINVPAIGIIPDRNYYQRRLRCKDDYIYLTVNFLPSSKKYNYLTTDDSIQIGDWVLVPSGYENHLHECLVIDKNYYKKDEVPYPLSKIKKVVKKINND